MNNNKKQWFWLYVMYTTNLVFLNRGQFCPAPPSLGDNWQRSKTILIITTEGSYWHLVGRGQEYC